MAEQLVVLVGAGASYDSAPPDDERALQRGALRRLNLSRRPPLVPDLFSDSYRDVLAQYPLAQAAGSTIRPRLVEGVDRPRELEKYLREELLGSPDTHRRAQYWAVPLYLQHLFHHCGWNFTRDLENYDRLVTALLSLPRVTFVSLNYDTMLDRVIDKYYPLNQMHDYIAYREMILVKPHGSVNWGRAVEVEGLHAPHLNGHGSVSRALAVGRELSNVVVLRAPASEEVSIERLRYDEGAPHFFYPALSAPLGPNDDTEVCPKEDTEALRQSLDPGAFGRELHLLVLGYSCLDKAPLHIIEESGSIITSAVFVNGSRTQSEAALREMQSYLKAAAPREDRDYVEIFDGGFTEFAHPDTLEALVERVRAAK